MNKYNTIAINGSHDASVTFIDKNGDLRIYEYERFVKKRYAMFSKFMGGELMGTTDENRIDFLGHLKDNLYNTDIRYIIWHDMNQHDFDLFRSFFPNAEFVFGNHHEAHAYGSVFLSDFDDCLIFSIDGGGNDNSVVTYSNLFLYKNDKLSHLKNLSINLAWPYNIATYILSDVRSKPGCLSVAGKVMGLSGYGNVRHEWVEYFKNFYNDRDIEKLCGLVNLEYKLDILEGQIGWDFAKTSQYVFEELLFETIKPYVEEYNTNVIITGGCGLNVLFNQKLHDFLLIKNLKTFVSSVPNDSGLSYGMFVSKLNYEIDRKDICFSGYEILDANNYNIQNRYETLEISKLVSLLESGKIIGIINGNSEVGPRALGNRSIICYPAISEMKDILNSKVKFREWYRPFAPVCRLKDKDLFFENAPECKYMSYAPTVKESYRKLLPSITHIDNTSRLQTVTDGCMFNDILNEMENNKMIPVILNTSFNIKGYPILTTLEDAFYALNNTDMDAVVYDNKIYYKK